MMSLLQIIIIGLATWRVSSLFVNEDGPWFIFERLRAWSGIELVPDNPYFYHASSTNWTALVPRRFLPQLLSCVWCFSMYAGAGWALLFFFFPSIAFWIALPFAASAATIVLNLVVEKLK